MTVIDRTLTDLPPGTVAVASWGLLSRVRRPCPDHGRDCACVARHEDEGCLVFWCEAAEHHFTTR
jgi:hypothetical protein